MRADLDRMMQERGIAGLVVLANDRYSAAMHYLTGQRIHHAVYFRAADGRAHLIHDPMERDQAALAGCETSSFAQHKLHRITEEEGDPARGFGRLIAEACATLGLKGAVVFAGEAPAGFGWSMVARALELNRDLAVDRSAPDLLAAARTTKDPDEIAATRRAAEGTVAAMTAVRDHLASLHRRGEDWVNGNGRPVTLGDLRRLIQATYLAHGLAEDGESIGSMGRDAGVPHNRGNDEQPLRAGVPILGDIFPGEAGGGYHADMTRTFCLGEAPAELRRLYDDVHAAFRGAIDGLAVGAPCRDYQERTCDVFEQRGHATPRSNAGTQEGYVHGLGHGVGLSVHEAPRLGGPPSNTQTLSPGMVVTVEPGLYYPSRGLGARIEDLVLAREDGTFENLTPFPYALEIESRA